VDFYNNSKKYWQQGGKIIAVHMPGVPVTTLKIPVVPVMTPVMMTVEMTVGNTGNR
jgi:hypothetical protein